MDKTCIMLHSVEMDAKVKIGSLINIELAKIINLRTLRTLGSWDSVNKNSIFLTFLLQYWPSDLHMQYVEKNWIYFLVV